MSVVQMAGVSVVGLPEGIERLSRKLLSEGYFEPMPIEAMLGGESPRARVRLFKDNPYEAAAPLERIKRLWKMAGEKFPEGAGERSMKISISEAVEFEREISGKIAEWDAWGERLHDDKMGLQALILISEALTEAGYTIKHLNASHNISYSIGHLLAENWNRLQELSTVSPLFVIQLERKEKHILALILYSHNYKKEANKLFDTLNFQEYSGSFLTDDFESVDAMRERLASLENEIYVHSKAAERYLENNREKCNKKYNEICSMQRVYSLMLLRGEVAGMTAISGFVPLGKIEHMQNMASKEAPDAVFITDSGANIAEFYQAPTLLQNNFFARIFHDIVSLYSIPAYGEFDPSPIVAFSFCLFFGLMFGDVGHGAMLALGAWWLEKKGIMSAVFSKIIKVAGIVSVLFGVLYGSVFGKENIMHSLWLSPMKDMKELIVISMVIGVSFLSLGFMLRLRALYRKRDWGELLFSGEGTAGILFYWTALGALVYGMSSLSSSIIKWLLTLTLVSLFAVIVLEKYLTKIIFHKEPESDAVVHLFSVSHTMLSFVSNTASFVRLAAFAMNHAGLSLAVYMLADMVRGAPLGGIYSAIIVIFGNIIIVSLEGLIVFIQTLRLEYYEFFSKFFEGGGRKFAPITWKE
ncbi:MAG: ATPase [Synergistaceae bacterium]|nr:ATPase [Synergistaceae bacterium]